MLSDVYLLAGIMMAQQNSSLFQIESFAVYGEKVRGCKHYVSLSLQEVKEVVEVLISGLKQGKVEAFMVAVYEEELEQLNSGVNKKTAQIIV